MVRKVPNLNGARRNGKPAKQTLWNGADPIVLGRLDEMMKGAATSNFGGAQGIATMSRSAFFGQIDPRRDIDAECGYPPSTIASGIGALPADLFKMLYDREPVATRVVELLPKESWQVSPLVYETDDPTEETDFERAWDELGQSIADGQSWYADEGGSRIWEALFNADKLSGIGHFGIILLGFDDGRNLDQPVDGVVTLQPPGGKPKPGVKNAAPKLLEHLVTRNRYVSHRIVDRAGKRLTVTNAQLGKLRRRRQVRNVLATRATLGPPQVGPASIARFGRFPGDGRAEKIKDRERQLVSAERVRNRKDLDLLRELGIAPPPAVVNDYDTGDAPYQYDPPEGPAPGRQYSTEGSQQGGETQYMGVQLGPSQYPAEEPAKQQRRLLFMQAFSEDLIQVVQYEANRFNPRFGQPVIYRVTLNDPREQHSGIGLPLATVRVHWSRVIHLADNRNTSRVFGVPRLRPVLNRIMDLQKLHGAAAEGYWKSAFNLLSFETHPQLGGDVDVDHSSTAPSAKPSANAASGQA